MMLDYNKHAVIGGHMYVRWNPLGYQFAPSPPCCGLKIPQYQILWKSILWSQSCYVQTDMIKLIGAVLLLMIMTRGISNKIESQTYVHLIFDGIYLCSWSSKLLQYIRRKKPDLWLIRGNLHHGNSLPTRYFHKVIIDLEYKYHFWTTVCSQFGPLWFFLCPLSLKYLSKGLTLYLLDLFRAMWW